jgi:hypothetical protein
MKCKGTRVSVKNANFKFCGDDQAQYTKKSDRMPPGDSARNRQEPLPDDVLRVARAAASNPCARGFFMLSVGAALPLACENTVPRTLPILTRSNTLPAEGDSNAARPSSIASSAISSQHGSELPAAASYINDASLLSRQGRLEP